MLMKKSTFAGLLFSLSSLLLFNSCEEILPPPKSCAFDYDQLTFTQGGGQPQEISPNFARRFTDGTFSSEPGGLAINDTTGVIDINASDPGEYRITFENENTSCQTFVLIQEGEEACSLSYGTNVVTPGEKKILVARVDGEPVSDGKFYAEPAGLRLNATNGAIDVAASESGIKYTIYYKSADGNITCQTNLTISGINYQDTVLNFNTIDAEIVEVAPVYVDVENEELPAPEGRYFAVGDNEQSLAINNANGSIDVKSTLRRIEEIEFGGSRPDNINKLFRIQYELDQQDIVSSIEVQILWYPTLDDIPAEIKEILEGRGVIINGKVEKRPPYILTVGDYGQ